MCGHATAEELLKPVHQVQDACWSEEWLPAIETDQDLGLRRLPHQCRHRPAVPLGIDIGRQRDLAGVRDRRVHTASTTSVTTGRYRDVDHAGRVLGEGIRRKGCRRIAHGVQPEQVSEARMHHAALASPCQEFIPVVPGSHGVPLLPASRHSVQAHCSLRRPSPVGPVFANRPPRWRHAPPRLLPSPVGPVFANRPPRWRHAPPCLPYPPSPSAAIFPRVCISRNPQRGLCPLAGSGLAEPGDGLRPAGSSSSSRNRGMLSGRVLG